MAPNPQVNAGKPVVLRIVSAGVELADLEVLSVEIRHEMDRIPRAILRIREGDPASGSFPVSAQDAFVPGQLVTIGVNYEGARPERLFRGLVMKHGLELGAGRLELVVEMADPAVRLTLGRSAQVKAGVSLAKVFTAAARAVGLEVGALPGLDAEQETVVQADASDWDFMVAASRAAGGMVRVRNGVLEVVRPSLHDQPVLTLPYGDALLRTEVRIDASDQYAPSAAQAQSWDYVKQKVAKATAAEVRETHEGSLTSEALIPAAAAGGQPLRTPASLSDDALKAWASSVYLRSRLSRLQGEVEFQGTPLAKPGTRVELQRLGPRLSGYAWVRGVVHRLSASGWTSTALLGLEGETRGDSAEPAAGLLPPLRGLHVGTVRKIATDPAGQHRVLVDLPLLAAARRPPIEAGAGDEEEEEPEDGAAGSDEAGGGGGDDGEDHGDGVWARLTSPYASNGFGVVAFPEVDDEVMVAFVNEDPRAAVILGSLYSSGRPPTYPADSANTRKAWVGRSKLEITFNDADVVLELRTPNGRVLTLSDKDEAITLQDGDGNFVKLDKSGVKINAYKDMTISATGKITLDAGGDLSAVSRANVSVSGQSTTVTGSTSLSLQSTGTGVLNATETLSITSALIRIN